ncbi:TetR/AcrR family transcriptional regulator [Rhizobium leguminosarum]|uniref:TetR/AcrR family transcriptional regulator n=1 Tax=Rhizobium leguminosarum TaxID=384 RepID=UPI003F9B7CD9
MPKKLNDVQIENLIEAAGRVIREEGVAAATTRRIAADAGVPLGTLHYYFESKQKLFEAVSDRFGATGKEWVSSHVSEGMGVANAAGAIARAFARWAARTPPDQLTEFELGIWALRTKTQFKLPQQSYEEWLSVYRELLAKSYSKNEREKNIEAIARTLVALVDGFIIQDQFLRESALPGSADRLIDAVVVAIGEGAFDYESPTVSSDQTPNQRRVNIID